MAILHSTTDFQEIKMELDHQVLLFIRTNRPLVLQPVIQLLGSSLFILFATVFMTHTAINIQFALINKPGDIEMIVSITEEVFIFSGWYGLGLLLWLAMKFQASTAWEKAMNKALPQFNKEIFNTTIPVDLRPLDGKNPHVDYVDFQWTTQELPN